MVQINPGPIKPILFRLGEVLSYLPDKVIKPKRFNNTMLFRIQSEIPPVVQLRLKVEINCYEHFNELRLVQVPFSYDSLWAKGSCSITTYKLNELLGTKLLRPGISFDATSSWELVRETLVERLKKYPASRSIASNSR